MYISIVLVNYGQFSPFCPLLALTLVTPCNWKCRSVPAQDLRLLLCQTALRRAQCEAVTSCPEEWAVKFCIAPGSIGMIEPRRLSVQQVPSPDTKIGRGGGLSFEMSKAALHQPIPTTQNHGATTCMPARYTPISWPICKMNCTIWCNRS